MYYVDIVLQGRLYCVKFVQQGQGFIQEFEVIEVSCVAHVHEGAKRPIEARSPARGEHAAAPLGARTPSIRSYIVFEDI